MATRTTLAGLIAALLSTHVLSYPSPQVGTIPNFDPSKLKNFKVQPNTGGGQSDDCGNGPVSLNIDTWNQHNMDQVIQSVWDSGANNANFDFHQAFGDKYGVDLYCPNSFTVCEGDPSSCSQLKGTTEEKTQGWLGIKAIMSAQQYFIQQEKAMDLLDGVQQPLDQYFNAASDVPISPQAGRKAAINAGGALLAGFAQWGALFVEGAAAAGSIASAAAGPVGLLAVGGIAVLTGFINDKQDDELARIAKGAEMSLADVLQGWDWTRKAAMQAIDDSHNAAFSNGVAPAGQQGPKLVDVLKGGAFAGTEIAQAYSTDDNSLRGIMSRLFFIKTVEATSRDVLNGFYLYIPNVIGDCPKWKKNTGRNQAMRYCAEKGMYILMGINPKNDGAMNSPDGIHTNELVASYGDYNIQLQDLHRSNALTYEGHGLKHSGISYFLPDILKSWKDKPDNSIFAQKGMFYLPVCQIEAWNWKQSDNADKNHPPCDCLTAQDPWGSKFMDVAPDAVKDWINKGCGGK